MEEDIIFLETRLHNAYASIENWKEIADQWKKQAEELEKQLKDLS